MEIRYKNEWPLLIKVGNKNNLEKEQIILLLAFREFKNGEPGNEFDRLDALGNNIEAQAISMAHHIKEREFYYQKYLKRLSVKENAWSFLEYIVGKNSETLKKYVELVNKEFS